MVEALRWKRILRNSALNGAKFVLATTVFGTLMVVLGKPVFLWVRWLWTHWLPY